MRLSRRATIIPGRRPSSPRWVEPASAARWVECNDDGCQQRHLPRRHRRSAPAGLAASSCPSPPLDVGVHVARCPATQRTVVREAGGVRHLGNGDGSRTSASQFVLELVQGDDELDGTAIEEQLIAIQLLTTQDTPEEFPDGDLGVSKTAFVELVQTFTDKNPFRCDGGCARRFSTAPRLKERRARVHGRVHTGARPYACERCEKRFSAKNHLRRHDRVHTGERPPRGPRCDQGFTQRSNGKIHLRVHRHAGASRKRKPPPSGGPGGP
ncbi:unnamed protein product [Arctogadus glacialis]